MEAKRAESNGNVPFAERLTTHLASGSASERYFMLSVTVLVCRNKTLPAKTKGGGIRGFDTRGSWHV